MRNAALVGWLLAFSACGQSVGAGGGGAYGEGGPVEGANDSGAPGTANGSDGDGGASAAASDSGARAPAEPMTTKDAATTGATEGGPPAVVTCPTQVSQPGDSNGSLQVGGTTRSYILHVPTGYTGKTPIPLVVDYHPILSTDTYERQNSGYATLGDTEGFAVVFPQGIDNAWNIGPCCTTSRTVDDLGFSRSLVQAMQAKVCVDPKRIYAVGYSMGGGMAHYLGCNAADLFASIAPAAFDLLQASEEPCTPSRPITEITFRGTADPIVPYAGGASMPPNGLNVTIHFLGAEGTFQKWSQLDGCTGSPSTPDANGCSTYSQCKDGVEATLCTKQGGGHDTGNPQIGWAMLKAHPMP